VVLVGLQTYETPMQYEEPGVQRTLLVLKDGAGLDMIQDEASHNRWKNRKDWVVMLLC